MAPNCASAGVRGTACCAIPSEGPTVFELKQAFRSLLRRPAYTMVVVTTLAVAASAGIAGVTLVDNILLRPLPYAEPDELHTLWKADEMRRSDPAHPAQQQVS